MKQGALESAGIVSRRDAFTTSVSSSTLHGCIAKHSIWKKKALTFTTGPSTSVGFVALAIPVLRRTSESLLNLQCQKFLIIQLSKCQYFTHCLKIMVVWFISIIIFILQVLPLWCGMDLPSYFLLLSHYFVVQRIKSTTTTTKTIKTVWTNEIVSCSSLCVMFLYFSLCFILSNNTNGEKDSSR